jgi:hypothetical protein
VRGLLVHPHGRIQVVETFESDWSLAALYGVLDCTEVETVYPSPSVPGGIALTLWFDANGKFRNLPRNPGATGLMEGRLQHGDYIAGPVLITGFDPDSGAELTLDLAELLRITERLVRAERAALAAAPKPESG